MNGDQTVASVQAMGEEAIRLGVEMRATRKPALILDNLMQMKMVPPEAREMVVKFVRSSDYDRLAMLGSGALLKLGANLLLQATGRGKCVRYFDDRNEAIRWLKQKA